MNDKSNNANKRPRCETCGRFLPRDEHGQVYYPCVSWDPYMGAWEHR